VRAALANVLNVPCLYLSKFLKLGIDYDIVMDPYEPLPIDTAAAGVKKPGIQWVAIGIAFFVQLAGSILMILLLSGATQIPELIFLGICLGIPYVCGAACLSYLVKSNWILHGLIYALICPSPVLLPPGNSELPSLGIFLVWEFFTVLLTLSTMAILRKGASRAGS
jgi:hypothetical protein